MILSITSVKIFYFLHPLLNFVCVPPGDYSHTSWGPLTPPGVGVLVLENCCATRCQTTVPEAILLHVYQLRTFSLKVWYYRFTQL